ncbi:UvrD-helicase domain-containing protein, partial [Aeromonas veronii]
LLKSLNIDDEKFPPKNVQYFINGAKEQGLRAGDLEIANEYDRRMADLYAAYDAQCQREGVVDFAELLLRCYELLRYNDAIRAHYQRRF